jgi:hypothetical protein
MVILFWGVCAIIVYALWAKGDVTVNGKVGWFSFNFQAKDRKRQGSTVADGMSLTRARIPPVQRQLRPKQ